MSFAPKNNMTVQEAEDLFEKYFAGKPKFKHMIDEAREFARINKFIEVPESGFRRNLLDVDSHDFKTKSGAFRQALNTMIQGFSAYIMQRALMVINKFFHDNNIDASIIVTVHDSMVVSTNKDLVPLVGSICKHVMENLPLDFLTVTIDGEQLYFPMKADLGVAVNYNDELPYHEEDFVRAINTESYCSFYQVASLHTDLKESGIITDEYHDIVEARHNEWKERYLVEGMSNPEIAEYHKEALKLRQEPVEQ